MTSRHSSGGQGGHLRKKHQRKQRGSVRSLALARIASQASNFRSAVRLKAFPSVACLLTSRGGVPHPVRCQVAFKVA